MTVNPESARARRYLLGEAGDEECAALEQEYLEHPDALDRMASAEDDLIEDYLAGQLDPADRTRFERAYLPVPHRRVRVETIRRLMAHASRSASATRETARSAEPKRTRLGPWLALAASFVAAFGALRVLEPFADGREEIVAPRLFALTLSPATVRSESGAGAFVIPAGTDVVSIRLERDAGGGAFGARRASIQVVGGAEAWNGRVTPDAALPPGTAARVDVPAASLPPDDYLVTLYGADRSGVEREWTQYFLRVRSE